MGTPPDIPPGARDVVVEELPLPVSEQTPPVLPPPAPPVEPDPGGGATIAT